MRLLALALACALLATTAPPALPAAAQEIIQAQLLDLTVLEVQVIVAGARGDDEVRCLLRGAGGRVRVGGVERVARGASSGRTTVVEIPLPVLEPGEREFAVALVRGETEISRTAWRPLASP